jgi:hypothetical protein
MSRESFKAVEASRMGKNRSSSFYMRDLEVILGMII